MLVVLPFAIMTGDPGQEYFADGITEDLTAALSHLRWFAVIARNSAFTYKGRAVDVRQVGRELGVGHVPEGSARKAGNRVRIGAQLCEAEAGRQVWAGRFDGDLADVFDLQDRVTEAVAGAIEPSLRMAEAERSRAKPTESLGAYDLYLRALAPPRAGSPACTRSASRRAGRRRATWPRRCAAPAT
jgi:adenylate cyclase